MEETISEKIDATINAVASGQAIGTAHFESDSNESSEWTIVEREKLLTGLKKYGPFDLAKLKKIVGTRSVREILLFLKDMKFRAETELDQRQFVQPPTSIEHWVEIVDYLLDYHHDYSSEIERVLLKFSIKLRDSIENRYTYTTSNGSLVEVEYSRIMTHLACLVKGCALNKLTSLESFIMLHLLRRLNDFVKNLDLTGASQYLSLISEAYKNGQLIQTCDDLTLEDEGEVENMDVIFDKSFNPLNISPELIEPNLLIGESLTLNIEPIFCAEENA